MNDQDFINTLLLTIRVASLTTLILFAIGVPLAWWLAYTENRFKTVIETFVSMPLVLPPTVLGFYLLTLLSPANLFGSFLENQFGLRLVFTFEGIILGSILFSLPFMVHPLQSGFSAVPVSVREAAETLGFSKARILFQVLLPNIKPSLLAGGVLSFAHTVGEFGVVLMVGGNIQNKTRMASIAIYDRVEALDYASAHRYALVLFVISFAVLLAVYLINSRNTRINIMK